ncbi:hypothetical protein R3P38DRAFT_2782220 [Favolaschia claudopus]|uniref:Uncharacterized protein n=1 Tax=Favolaschia claudopus TaxID=2862362 RepID=A0AAW0B1W4_9AGAR
MHTVEVEHGNLAFGYLLCTEIDEEDNEDDADEEEFDAVPSVSGYSPIFALDVIGSSSSSSTTFGPQLRPIRFSPHHLSPPSSRSKRSLFHPSPTPPTRRDRSPQSLPHLTSPFGPMTNIKPSLVLKFRVKNDDLKDVAGGGGKFEFNSKSRNDVGHWRCELEGEYGS